MTTKQQATARSADKQAILAIIPVSYVMIVLDISLVLTGLPRGASAVLVVGLAIGIVGAAWLSRASAQSGYIVAVALPMLLIGVSQGLTLSPLTAAGVAREDAGAASGAVNMARQVGSSVGLGVLVAVAGLGAGQLAGRALLVHRIETALDGATAMLALALVIALLTIVRRTASASQAATAADGASPLGATAAEAH